MYIIAEIGINHGGMITRALHMIDKAAECGVDAVKFQTYDISLRKKDDLWDIFDRCRLTKDGFMTLKEHSEKVGLDFISTPLDIPSVDLLKDMYTKAFKISSSDVRNTKLIDRILDGTGGGVEIFTSLGMHTLEDAEYLYNKIVMEGEFPLTLMHCVSAYPTDPNEANLRAIHTLKRKFHDRCVDIGYSDHVPGIKAALHSVSAGAKVIEKHFKVDDDCVDAAVSIFPDEMATLVKGADEIEKMMGSGRLGMTESQETVAKYRRVS